MGKAFGATNGFEKRAAKLSSSFITTNRQSLYSITRTLHAYPITTLTL